MPHPSLHLPTLATEQSNRRTQNLDTLSIPALLKTINREDHTVPRAVAKAIPQISKVVTATVERLKKGGRLIYIGAGTSGRLGCLDASEMPPTYGVPSTLVQGLIAGGNRALLRSIEGAEDDGPAGSAAVERKKISERDVVVGISASGRARFVRDALSEARLRGAYTACITCNRNSLLIAAVEQPIVVETGPEAVAGSTRMKAGTAQKLVLNMLSTAVMVRLGRVRGNRMAHMQIRCEKLRERAAGIVMEESGADLATALNALELHRGSVQAAILFLAKLPNSTSRRP